MLVGTRTSFLSHFCLAASCNFPLCHTLSVRWQVSVLEASTNTWYTQIWENPSNSSCNSWPKPRLSEPNRGERHTGGTLPSSHSHINPLFTRGGRREFLNYIFFSLPPVDLSSKHFLLVDFSFHNSLAFTFVKIKINVPVTIRGTNNLWQNSNQEGKESSEI